MKKDFSQLFWLVVILYDMHREIKIAGADVLIGNSYGAHIAEEESIPLFRTGFPIFDRLGCTENSYFGI